MNDCQFCKHIPLPERKANALNVEVGSPLPRCMLKTPSHWPAHMTGFRWIVSGGDAYVFGPCTPNGNCPKRAIPLVKAAVEAGLVVQAEHPDFGGTLTIGRLTNACGPGGFCTIHHGGSCDVGTSDSSLLPVVRLFCFQLGERTAQQAACKALVDDKKWLEEWT